MLTFARVRELLDYTPETGVLTWKVARRHAVKAGDVAGFVDGNGRRMVEIDEQGYHVGPVIWLWVTGQWPVNKVDHKDRNPLNNRWENLRDVTKSVDAQNRSVGKNNKSGVRGVFWNTRQERWQAQITLDRRHRHLGLFVDFDKAVAARKIAESTLWNLPEGG